MKGYRTYCDSVNMVHKMEQKKPTYNILKSIIFGIFVVICFCYFYCGSKPAPNLAKTGKVAQPIEPTKIIQPTLFNCVFWLNVLDVQYPNIAIRQIQLESGNLSSVIFKENNNCFGMRKPNRRPTTAIGSNRGFAVYNSFIESIIDYRLYQQYIGVPDGLTDRQYCEYPEGCNYWEDENYIKKLMGKKKHTTAILNTTN